MHQHKHFVQVHQALLDLTVQHAQKVERYVQLDHEGVDHHQVAQRHATLHYTLCSTPQHTHKAYRDDELLAGVEHGERGLAFQAGAAQLLQAFVVALGFKGFVIEVLDSFVIEQ